jgi:hypothetical protein
MNDYLTKEETDKIYDNLTIIIAPTGGRDSGKIMNDELFYAGINQAIKLWIKKTFEITKRQQEEILRLKNKIDPDTKNLIVY